MRIFKNETSAVIIDVQEKLFPHIHEHDLLLRKLNTLIKGLSLLKVQVLATEQYPEGLGATIKEVKDALQGVEITSKRVFSCHDSMPFKKQLHFTGSKYVILAGIEAHVCVLQTAVDLKAAGYEPVVIADAVASRSPYDKEIAMNRFTQEDIKISTVESILLELCRTSSNEMFRDISKLVK